MSNPDNQSRFRQVNVMERVKKRRDYLAAAGGAKAVRSAFILQSRRRNDGRDDTGGIAGPARFGFTVTRRTARNAVDRNRIRRRLKAAARLAGPAAAPGHDLVLIGRRAALSVAFDDLVADLESAIVETRENARSGGDSDMDNGEGARERGGQTSARGAARRQT